jgi:hypothetical protein
MKKILLVGFGVSFSFIGFANTFWGNDPYFGLAILALSVFYYIPLIDVIRAKLNKKITSIVLVVIGFFILWSSAGVGELNDKLEMMIENFPNTKITGY